MKTKEIVSRNIHTGTEIALYTTSFRTTRVQRPVQTEQSRIEKLFLHLAIPTGRLSMLGILIITVSQHISVRELAVPKRKKATSKQRLQQ